MTRPSSTAMTGDARQKLRDAALAVRAGLRSRGQERRPAFMEEWQVQTSNSFRRIGTVHGDGDVLCGTKHPIDGHPDLLAAPGVLDYIVAAQPRVLVQLLDDVASLEDKLAAAKVQCDRIADVETRLDKVAGTITALGEAFTQLTSLDPGDAEKARAFVDQIMTTLREAQR
jgi:hypothetical protein